MRELELKIRKANKTALVFGATGLVGSYCVNELISDPAYKSVLVFNRREVEYKSEKLVQIIIDYDNIEAFEHKMKGDDVFICLGTTMAKAGSKKAFLKVDYTYVMKAALAALRQGANQLLVVSSAGSDKNSFVFYNKVKGELEYDISRMNYWAIHIFKPSLILGERSEKRVAENLASRFATGLDRVLGSKLAAYRPAPAKKIARAMTRIAGGLEPGVYFYDSNTIVELGSV